MRKLVLALLFCLLAVTTVSSEPLKSPSRSKLVEMQGGTVITWTTNVSLATYNSYAPGAKISLDNGATSQIAGATCSSSGVASVACSAPFPAVAKGTYPTIIYNCDSQGAKIKCTAGPVTSHDFLPAPAAPGPSNCPGCSPTPTPTPTPTAVTLVWPVAGQVLSQISDVLINVDGVANAVTITVRDAGGSFVCTCDARYQGPLSTGQHRWVTELNTPNAPNGGYSITATALVGAVTSVSTVRAFSIAN